MIKPLSSADEAKIFRYGWRYVPRKQEDGSESSERVPLTLEDVLHPQEDDVIPENYVHEKERGDLTRIFRRRMRRRFLNWIVLSDCIVNWNVKGIKNHSPDISIFVDLREMPKQNFGTFLLRRWGGRCLLAMEIVSPHTRENDVERKPDHYHQVGIPLYIIIDQIKENGPRTLYGFRHTKDGYEEMKLDSDGRLPIEDLGLLLGLEDNEAVFFDAETGEPIPTWEEEADRREAAEQKAQQEEQARLAAEKRIRDLEKELKQLRE